MDFEHYITTHRRKAIQILTRKDIAPLIDACPENLRHDLAYYLIVSRPDLAETINNVLDAA